MTPSRGRHDRPKVVLIGHAAGATLNFRAPLIEELVKNGCQVEVLAPDWTPNQLTCLADLGAEGASFPLARTGMNPLQDLQTLLALYRHLRHSQPDVVLSYAAKTNVWGMLASALAGVRHRVAMIAGLGVAFTECPNKSMSRLLLRWTLATLYRAALYKAHRVVVQNPDDARYLTESLGISRDKLVLINGTGVPLTNWPICPPHRDPITFTLVARLLREKGVLEYLAAARAVKRAYPSARFWLLGPLDDNPGGLTVEDLQPWLQDGTVEWPGAVDVKPWLAQTSVFVLPSYREGVPRSTQEAMAMGRPVITTDVPGCRETVIEGVNGFSVPPRDVEALVQAMLRFIEQPQLIETMGRESRRLAETRFDVRRANQILLETMNVDRRGPGP
ncbi:MAG: glycosyltransferase family 4 protein [Methylophilaceae bacterium]|nr:glycosyltransferase family 4 protein [Methylophilaceae bacterium]